MARTRAQLKADFRVEVEEMCAAIAGALWNDFDTTVEEGAALGEVEAVHVLHVVARFRENVQSDVAAVIVLPKGDRRES